MADARRRWALIAAAILVGAAACGHPVAPRPCVRWAVDTVTTLPVRIVVSGHCLERAE